MGIENLHKFLYTFFSENNSQITNQSKSTLDIQLSPELDEQLMNRPFYWQYVKKMGLQGEATSLHLTVDPNEDSKYEFIHFGSPRLQKIMEILADKGKYAKLYQSVDTNQHIPLVPWFVLNVKISYIGTVKKEILKSIGINMINGAMVNQMIDHCRNINWDIKISDFCYTLTPLIHVKHSYQRIIQLMKEHLQQESHQWAVDAWNKMNEEKTLLQEFYQTEVNDYQNHYQQELASIEALYQPKIELSVVNGGLFFITQPTTFQILNT
ncbi:YqhG family protein [Paraliobacillus ryukyuensis]|uniref:YqhG family protein n=1 Tax=Paraliobacillus ryukyuensis TaxID=200904 RepID=UPI0009A65124|nr:YqhG family protein [Paraliobacillus ryukyuensis]